MKLPVRLAALAAAALVATACTPQTSSNSASDTDDQSGTLRVWLFQEVGNTPKEKVVDSVVTAFAKAHKARRSTSSTSRSTPAPSASRPPSTTRSPPPT